MKDHRLIYTKLGSPYHAISKNTKFTRNRDFDLGFQNLGSHIATWSGIVSDPDTAPGFLRDVIQAKCLSNTVCRRQTQLKLTGFKILAAP